MLVSYSQATWLYDITHFIGGFVMVEESKKIYSIKEIQDILGICKTSAYALVKRKEFHSIRIGDTYRISKISFDEWLNKRKGEC